MGPNRDRFDRPVIRIVPLWPDVTSDRPNLYIPVIMSLADAAPEKDQADPE